MEGVAAAPLVPPSLCEGGGDAWGFVVGAFMTVVVVAGGAMEADDEGAVPPVVAVVVVTFMTTGLAAAAWGAGVGVSVDSAGVPATCTCSASASALVFPVCTVSALLVLNVSLRCRRLLPSELSHWYLSGPHFLAGGAGAAVRCFRDGL